MAGLAYLLSIKIGIDPAIVTFGSLQLTWHGVFTAVGIAAGVYLGAWLGRRQGFTEDDAYSIALVGVPAGIIGARALYVIENYQRFQGQWFESIRINEGGISVYGAVIAGVLGAVVYGVIRKMPITRGLDAAVFGLLLGMGTGRLGDLVNGEHVGKPSGLPWAVEYTNINSPAYQFGATHPATTYEMIGDLLIIGIIALVFVKLWQTRPGVTFFSGLVLYSAMRFGVSYLRIDSGLNCPNVGPGIQCPETVIKNWMSFPQAVSMVLFFIGSAGLIWTLARKPEKALPASASMPGATSGKTAAPARP